MRNNLRPIYFSVEMYNKQDILKLERRLKLLYPYRNKNPETLIYPFLHENSYISFGCRWGRRVRIFLM